MAYKLLGPDGVEYASETPGTLGGNRRLHLYGTLDCPSAERAIAAGGYVRDRVFFADERIALAAGFRPCARCLPAAYAAWKGGRAAKRDRRAVDFSRPPAKDSRHGITH
jgi:hypothetical protein